MDCKGFLHWINTWYEEVKKLSNGPWLLLMDNCGGHELSITPDGVRIEFLPPRSTTKHQALDIGLIASAKIRYRTRLLIAVFDVMGFQRNTNHCFKETSCNGKWGLQHGMLPHVGDSIMLFDSSWKMMTRSEIIKCWFRSECLGVMHVNQNRFVLDQERNSTDVKIDLTNSNSNPSDNGESVVEEQLARRIQDGITDYRNYANDCNTPLTETLSEVQDIVQPADLLNCLNSPAPQDAECIKQNVTVGEMMEVYDNEDSVLERIELEPTEASRNTSEEALERMTTLNSLSQFASDAQGITEDEALLNALHVVQERVNAIKDAKSYTEDK